MQKTLLYKRMLLVSMLLFSTSFNVFAQQNISLIDAKLSSEREKNGWTKADITGYFISDQYTDNETGLTHTYIQQRYRNIVVYNAISIFLIKDNKVVYFNPGFIDHLEYKIKTDKPAITAEAAIGYALLHLGHIDIPHVQLVRTDNTLNSYIFESPDISSSPVKVQLVYRATDYGIFLAWDVSMEMKSEPHWWNVRVNALTGEFIDKNDFTIECTFDDHSNDLRVHVYDEASFAAPPPLPLLPPPATPEYTVFAFPLEAPSFGSRSLLQDPADPVASPFGWHDVDGIAGSEFTITRGNNVHAYEDQDNNNLPGYSPDTSTLQFNYPFTNGAAPLTNLNSSITNLFYANNRIHDVLYHLGFNEVSGNFQQNNYGNGGLGNDYVKAEAFDGGGTNNANFSTPADGVSGRMQMYLWTAPASCSSLNVTSTGYTGTMSIAIASFSSIGSVTDTLILVNDSVGTTTDACSPILNNVAGKIALIDRGTCNFIDKALAAQTAGAVGVIIANNVTGGPQVMTGTPVLSIPCISISLADGNTLKSALLGGTVVGTITTCGNLDGSFDNGIIAHEYGHGVSNRLTGGPSQSGCLSNAEQGGEGWSDWLALMMTIEPGDSGAMARGIGTYAKGQPTNGPGIRRFPYSTNMTINPQTYADVAGSTSVHNIGEIWCDAIWDMSWFLIDDLGFNPDPTVLTAGNNIAMRLVLQGMKLQPCGPGFLDARDAILTADAILYNNAHRCRIWEAFARRGMGFNAIQGSANSATDQTAGFSMPPYCLPATQVPVAAFTSNLTTIPCGGTVQFTDQSVQAFTWFWNFGDQVTSTLQNPSHTYSSPGSYIAKLVVTNPLGSDSITHTITVTSTFSVAASATPTTVCSGSPVQLNATGSGSSNITYQVTNITYAPVTGTLTTVPLTDDAMSTVKPIGFTFNFFGQNYSSFYICSNGFITFSSGQSPNVVYGVPIPSSSNPNNLIAAAWNDLNPANPGSTVGYFNTGVSPNQKLVVQYTTSHFGGTQYPFVVQAILSEGSNEIEIHTTTISDASAFDPAATTTQGIENANGSAGVFVPGRNGTLFSASNDAWRFTPYINYTYTWQPGNLNGKAQSVTPVATGTYSVYVTDGSGCTVSGSSPLITVNPAPAPTISGNTTICTGSSTTLDAGSYAAYEWSNGATTKTIVVNIPGSFTVTVTNDQGCTGSASVTTTTTVCCAISISGIVTPVSCFGGNSGSIDVTSGNVSGSPAYLWNNGATTEDRSGLAAGTYTVTVTYGPNCSQTQSFTVSQPPVITPSGIAANIVCKGINTGSITMSPTGGTAPYTYLWNNGSTSQNRNALGIGTYTVTVKDASLCSGTASFTITQPATNLIVNINKTNIRCAGSLTGVIIASPSGGVLPYDYLWNTIPVSTTATISGLEAGVYICSVTDAAGCTKTTVVTITEPPPVLVIPSQTNVTFPGGNNGTASVAVSGGTPGYTYNWNTIPAKTTAGVTGLSAGIYKCTVNDSKNCAVKISFVITEPFSRPQDVSDPITPEWKMFVSPNPSDGSITISVTGLKETEDLNFMLMDMAGRTIYYNKMQWLADDEKAFDFSNLPKGIYYLKCISHKHIMNQKIILQ